MSSRPTPETFLISAMLEKQDAYLAKEYGVAPIHFKGYRDEYEWLLAYNVEYGSCPTPAQIKSKFPDFPLTEESPDPRWSAQEMKRAYASRDLLTRCNEAVEMLAAGNVEDAFETVRGAQYEVVSPRPDNALIDERFFDDYDEEVGDRIPMPWKSLQDLTNGIGPGELWYVAARQGNGKSSYLIDMAVEAAFHGKRVLFYSMEMNKRQVQVRAHAAMAHRLGFEVDAVAMLHRRFDQEYYRIILTEIKKHLDEVGGEFAVHTPSMGKVSPSVIAGMADDYDLHMVDYIGLTYTDDGRPVIRDWRDIAEVSNQLKEIALAKNTRIIAASQINREGAGRSYRPPALHTLAQSDHLGNDGDVVLTMKRHGKGAGIFSVEKNRHGSSQDLFFTLYDPNSGDFTEITKDKADDIKDSDYDDD